MHKFVCGLWFIRNARRRAVVVKYNFRENYRRLWWSLFMIFNKKNSLLRSGRLLNPSQHHLLCLVCSLVDWWDVLVDDSRRFRVSQKLTFVLRNIIIQSSWSFSCILLVVCCPEVVSRNESWHEIALDVGFRSFSGMVARKHEMKDQFVTLQNIQIVPSLLFFTQHPHS